MIKINLIKFKTVVDRIKHERRKWLFSKEH